MAAYKIFFRKSVDKEFSATPKQDLRKIFRRIEMLSEDPRPSGCEKLTGQERFRVRQGRHRVVYSIQDNDLTVWIVRIGHWRDICR